MGMGLTPPVEPVDCREHPVRLARRQLEPEQGTAGRQRAERPRQAPPVEPRHHAEHGCLPPCRMQDAGQDLDRRRLPRAVRADVRDALARGPRERGNLADRLDPYAALLAGRSRRPWSAPSTSIAIPQGCPIGAPDARPFRCLCRNGWHFPVPAHPTRSGGGPGWDRTSDRGIMSPLL